MATATKVRKKQTGEAGNKGEFGTLHRGEVDIEVAERPIDQYTFLKQFEELDAQYERDFEGFPNRFFSADLRGKYLPPKGSPREDYYFGTNYATAIPQRMYQAVSDPSDLSLSDEQMRELATECGFTNIRPIPPDVAKSFRAGNQSVVANYNGVEVLLSNESAGSKNCRSYQFRGKAKEPFEDRNFVHLDLRALAANERIKRKTGVDMLPIVTGSENRALMRERYESGATRVDEAHLAKRRDMKLGHIASVRSAFEDLEEAQLEGRNFQAQRKYMKAKASSVATAWQDKKHPDDLHVEMARTTSLAQAFAKVEIDNDVDPESYATFEQAWDDTRAKLPPIPEGKEPVLRIRKLGKHRATGVYFPHVNTIAVDVRDSGSFIHEYGHYVDIVTKDNASLGADFRQVVGDYSKRLKVPAGQTGKYGADYYSTPTEVYARGFEMYAHERLGIDNRLLNPAKFERFDFGPFAEDPAMKERMFDLFDRAFERQTPAAA